jgi:hypothetical protein
MIDVAPKRVLHCWEGGPQTADDCGQTCMLPADHAGPHEWTRNDEIGIAFAPDPEDDEPAGSET